MVLSVPFRRRPCGRLGGWYPVRLAAWATKVDGEASHQLAVMMDLALDVTFLLIVERRTLDRGHVPRVDPILVLPYRPVHAGRPAQLAHGLLDTGEGIHPDPPGAAPATREPDDRHHVAGGHRGIGVARSGLRGRRRVTGGLRPWR